MTGKTVATIYRKEMLELVRDRRTLISMVLVPIIAIPALFFVMHYFMSSSQKQAAREAVHIAVPPRLAMPGLKGALQAAGFHLLEVPDLRAAVRQKKAAAAAEVATGAGGAPVVRLYVDASRGASDVAKARLRVALAGLKDAQVRSALAGSGVSEKVLTPFTIDEVDVAPQGTRAKQAMGGVIGYMVILMIFSGCMYPSIDMTAGEKERRTLEILLSSRAGRDEIVLGKILAASTAAFVTGALNVLSLTVSFRSGFLGDELSGLLTGVRLNTAAVLLLLVAVVPTAITAASVMVTISSFAKSFKEGQSYLSPLIMVVVFPAVIGLLPGMDANPRLALLPVFNVSQLIKSIFAGDYTAAAFLVSFGSNFVYAAIAFAVAVRIFQREDVLFRT